MKTSLDEMQLMEDCLLERASDEHRLLFEANLLVNPALREDAHWQRKTYGIISEYGRQQLRAELERVHHVLFTAPRHQAFRDRVLGFFRR
ncbi:hypothetical protein ACFQRK_01020 [Parapedobacter sp. GCM10030251]|uniref:hypothetical protein n=1 Tax=Parapedobacter sp. GCM10030251 TaxID=3273419 RepID=UPI00360C1E69